MKQLLIITALLCSLTAFAQNNTFATAGIAYTVGAPTFVPGARGTIIAIDTVSGIWYVSQDRNSVNWIAMGERLQSISGCVAPAYTPAKHQSDFVINSCATPELYFHTGGGTWVCLTCAASGATNLSWSGSSPNFKLNSSTGNDVVFKAGTNVTLSNSADTLTISATGGGAGTVYTDATLTGDGSIGDPLTIAQQSATTSQVIEWSGTAWEPSWGNPYTFVTSGSSITTAVNEVLVGTIAADAIFGLPTCNAANDGKRFKFVRNGTDAYSITIDPASTEQFYDGTSFKIQYGKISIDCTCRYSGGTGVWFFDNF